MIMAITTVVGAGLPIQEVLPDMDTEITALTGDGKTTKTLGGKLKEQKQAS